MSDLALAVFAFSASYRKARLLSFLRPEADPRGAGFQALRNGQGPRYEPQRVVIDAEMPRPCFAHLAHHASRRGAVE